tara:strand:+ start:38 stop:304 length:267 start_codon:yes stop_codon:yes gene_type:complete
MAVDYKDREEEVTLVYGALRLVDLNIDYETSSLILKTIEKTKELGMDFSIRDGAKIKADHQEEWKEYYDNKETESIEKTEAKRKKAKD